ncbi:MAG: ABC transporter permease [Armatimonadota bacterium]|nr:ABC transporter permease [Armatimonadota bacterium]
MRRLGALVALLAVWEAVVRMGWVSPLLVPPPVVVARVVADLVRGGALWGHVGATLLEALGGLGLGVAAGGLLGLAAGLLPPVADLLQPAMAVLNAVPRVILAPLLVIWFGIGVASKIALSFLLVAVTVFFAVYGGIRETDPRLVERVRTLGGDAWAVVREVYAPSVGAWVVSSLKLAVGFAFTGAVVGEFVASSRGLGYLLSFAQSTYNAALTVALIALVMAVTLTLFAGLERGERRLLRWKHGARPRRAPGSRAAAPVSARETVPAPASGEGGARTQPEAPGGFSDRPPATRAQEVG